MDNRVIIQKSLDYIEENLQTEITATELAEMAGFSLFHYYRLFQQATGMPVMQYILRRRLLHGVYAMKQGISGHFCCLVSHLTPADHSSGSQPRQHHMQPRPVGLHRL